MKALCSIIVLYQCHPAFVQTHGARTADAGWWRRVCCDRCLMGALVTGAAGDRACACACLAILP